MESPRTSGRGAVERPLALALALLAWLSGGCAQEAGERPTAARNLLLVTVDTLRADHLGCYGYERPTSPAIDALAQEAVLFERAKATSSWTLPTLASLLTSTLPPTHGCRDSDAALSQDFETLAERLAATGFRTGAIVNHIFLDERYGLDQGFAEYDQELVLETSGASHKAVTSPRVTEKAIEWLAERERERDGPPWFLWVHYFDPHHKYVFHEGVTEAFATLGPEGPTYTDIDLYDGEIAFTDRHIGALLAELEERGFAADTAVALVADHGEAFGERGAFGHRNTLYRETVRVPVLVRAPGLRPTRFEPPVSTLDLLPTLLAIVGVAPPPDAHGVDLLPALRGEREHQPRPILAELGGRAVPELVSIQRDQWKLIHDREEDRYELYELSRATGEPRDVAAERPDLIRALKWLMKTELERARDASARIEAPPRVDLRPEDRRRLESLGYGESGS